MKIDGVKLNKLKIIDNPNGNIFHIMKRSDDGFVDFGEAYFSTILFKKVKAWKKHYRMTLNLVVSVGCVKFVLIDDREDSQTKGFFDEVELSHENYCRLTIPPNIWIGFRGNREGINMILNMADIIHDPEEQININADTFKLIYNWE